MLRVEERQESTVTQDHGGESHSGKKVRVTVPHAADPLSQISKEKRRLDLQNEDRC